MFVRFLFVFDLLFNLFRIALLPSVGKELLPWLSTCAVFIVGAPSPFGVQGRMWNSIVSVPDHCLFIYFTYMFTLQFKYEPRQANLCLRAFRHDTF